MTAYSSLQMTVPRYPVSGPGIGGRNIHAMRGIFSLTAALALNDTVAMFRLHPRFRVVGGFVKAPDLDTGGSPAIVLALGDVDDDDRFFTGLTIGQAGGVNTTLASTGIDYLTTKYTDVVLKVTTGPATGATTGDIVASLFGYIEEPA
jgi:hypothetical protein